ncbi:hypothetical protein DPX16_12816 [Anabarilius grahami]|uniref:Uncharacterized protein n=1 Tax=Anabarilius grahami TaxID=495550 RepID=A0A3N0XD20_ANAGA|nr:hypothetical protein DPX16_12816 [Anabarilius grahami]
MYRGSSGGCGAGQKHDREGGADRGKHDNNPGRILGENGRKRQGVNPNRITRMQAHNGVGGWTDVHRWRRSIHLNKPHAEIINYKLAAIKRQDNSSSSCSKMSS